jgi:SAM-dependent methyltransferase
VIHEDRRRAESFGADASQYDRARPSYPAALVDDCLAGFDPATALRVLDVGCGTGIAARLFQERGARVLGVEIDERMAQVARGRGLTVELGEFETWDRGGRSFDLLTSAQAWHWIDPFEGAVKAAESLAPGGRVALFWNVGVLPAATLAAFDEVYQRLAPGLDDYSVLLGAFGGDRFDAAQKGLMETGRFFPPEMRTYSWEVEYTRAEWLDLLPTHSDHRALPDERLQHLLSSIGDVIDAMGGSFSMGYEAVLITADLAPATG